MSNDTRDSTRRFALQNLSYFIGNLMDANCRKTESTPQDIADCKAVRPSTIREAEDPFAMDDNAVRFVFETAGKEGWFGFRYGNRPMSVLFSQDGSSVKAALNAPHSFLVPNGGNVGVSCTEGILRDLPTGDVAFLDAGDSSTVQPDADASTQDASNDVCQEQDTCSAADLAGDVTDADAADVALDTEDAAGDVCQDDNGCFIDDAVDTADTITETADDAAVEVADAATDVAADAVADAEADATPVDVPVDPSEIQDALDNVDIIGLPNDISGDVAAEVADAAVADVAPEVADDAAATICQYFCDAGMADVGLADVATPSDDVLAPGAVTSALCTAPQGAPLSLFAPLNSVAAACTNESINAMILGATGCVAECGFYDDKVILSSDPMNPVKFSTSLFIPPADPKKPYTITLTMQAPILSNGSTPALPSFMGSSLVFAFNQNVYDLVGDIVWETQDKSVQIKYQQLDFFFGKPETLDIISSDPTGSKVSYRYPCDTLVDANGVSNPVVQCTEVK